MDENLIDVSRLLLNEFDGFDESGKLKEIDSEKYSATVSRPPNGSTFHLIRPIEKTICAGCIPQPDNGSTVIITGYNDDANLIKHGIFCYQDPVTITVQNGFIAFTHLDNNGTAHLTIAHNDLVFSILINGQPNFIYTMYQLTGNEENISEQKNELIFQMQWGAVYCDGIKFGKLTSFTSMTFIQHYLDNYNNIYQIFCNHVNLPHPTVFQNLIYSNIATSLFHQANPCLKQLIPDIDGVAFEAKHFQESGRGPYPDLREKFYTVYQSKFELFRIIMLDEDANETLVDVVTPQDFGNLVNLSYIQYPEESIMAILPKLYACIFTSDSTESSNV